MLLWIGLTDIGEARDRGPVDIVSILVVVDRTHGLACPTSENQGPSRFQSLLLWIGLTDCLNDALRERHLSGFNPCCCGSDSRTRVGRVSNSIENRVSILVVVDRTHGRSKAGDVTVEGRVFQSLLLWIGLTDERSLRRRDGNPCGFNPCCCGSDSRTVL